MTLTKAYELYSSKIRSVAYRNAPAYLKEDFYAEGLFVLAEVHKKYIQERPKKKRPSDEEFVKILMGSVKNKFRDLIHDIALKKQVRLTTSLSDPDNSYLLESVGDDQTTPLQESTIARVAAQEAVSRLKKAVEEELPENAMEVLKHMLWSKEAVTMLRINFLKRKHLKASGKRVYLTDRMMGAEGMIPVSIIQELTGLSDTRVKALIAMIREIAYREWGDAEFIEAWGV